MKTRLRPYQLISIRFTSVRSDSCLHAFYQQYIQRVHTNSFIIGKYGYAYGNVYLQRVGTYNYVLILHNF